MRGDNFGHYASISEIRSEAGFTNAVNLSDVIVDQQRRAAEAEINGYLRTAYTVPFIKPNRQRLKYLTIRLAVGPLLQDVYSGQGSSIGDGKVKDIRAQLAALQSGASVLEDDTQTPYQGQHVASWPNDSTAGLPLAKPWRGLQYW